MCGATFTAISAFASLFSAVNSMGGAGAAPQVVTPQAPKQAQAAKLPDQSVFKKAMGGGGDPTVLTGPQGIPDDKLLLGKSTVLGG